jgi:hypothetical protein
MTDAQKPDEKNQEPTMEDILASIRRILSEEGEEKTEDPAAADAPPARPHPAAPSGAARGRTLQSADAEEEPEMAGERELPPLPEVELAELQEAAEAEVGEGVLVLTPDMRTGPLVSAPTTVASTDVLSQLAKAILDRRDIAIGSRDTTIEGMVREMLRPLLQEWLDRNLPYLIERLVKREIDQMVNRAERLED